MFAVIKTGGKQYRVVADQLLKVEKIVGNTGDVVEFSDVLMIGEGDNTVVGTPVVSDALVTAEIVGQGRARKVIAFKKRRRQNSKRTRGHRQEITTLRILEVLTGGKKPKKAVGQKEIKETPSLKRTTVKTSEKNEEKIES
ncbi:50S ribosomal protein L21 [Bartonella sp. F02]|uniref:50S ribosomal protein L21 n=1 Tax=Bartonella sp. F02 TaxID=2967262 RepID=UPI0022A97817|nr:50S ribosomal protein L21 [Bartonella sp. F02]MCZ2328921.1 50S ribosomal protein L21 [Bartonella sp. F02]